MSESRAAIDERSPSGLSSLIGVVGLALILRLAAVWASPKVLAGDDYFYHHYALSFFRGRGYIEYDGSAAVTWMPGWPWVMSQVYSVFGESLSAVMVLNALLGAVSVGFILRFGEGLFGRRQAMLGAVILALWPAWVLYAGTLMTESLFGFLIFGLLLAVERMSASLGRSRWLWIVVASVTLAACAMVKAEPLALIPWLWLVLFCTRTSLGRFTAESALVVTIVLLLLTPWGLRNQAEHGRFMLTSAAGGLHFITGNRPDAPGKQDLMFQTAWLKHHTRATSAETMLAQSEAGWRAGARMAREQPIALLEVIPRKLQHTYTRDDEVLNSWQGPMGLRALGFKVDTEAGLPKPTLDALRWLVNGWWWAVLALSIVGLWISRGWPLRTQILIFGLPITWLGLHVFFLGGARAHLPETAAMALLASAALCALKPVSNEPG